MNLALLATLKDKLVHAKNFGDVMNYFFDHFGEDPDFIALGNRADDPFLEAVFEQVGEQIFGGRVRVGNLLLTHLPEHQFIHGGFLLNDRLANVIYFEDIHMGLMAVVWSVVPAETKMVRFSGRPLPPRGQEPSRN
jgi:hypothetical protein